MDAVAYKDEGNKFFAEGEFQRSIESFSKAIELDASNHVLYSNRSASYAKLGNFSSAHADAERCVQLNPTWAKGYVRLGAALHGLKQYDEAVKAYKKGLEVEPTNQSLLSGLKDVENDQKASSNPFAKMFGPDTIAKIARNPKLAPFLSQPDYVNIINMIVANPQMIQGFLQDQRIMQTLIEFAGINLPDEGGAKGQPAHHEKHEEPKPHASAPPQQKPAAAPTPASAAASASKAEQLKNEGNTLYKQRNFEGAIEKYNAALEIEPHNVAILLNRTAVFFEQENYELCITEVDAATAVAREHGGDYKQIAKLFTRKGSCLQKLNRHDEAIELFKKALLEHRNPETLSKLEACEKEKKLLDEKAYINPEISAQKKEEGNAFFKKDQYPDAVKCYTEAIRRNPTDHTLYSNRAAALLKLGVYEDAIKDCDKCLEINPTFIKAISRKGDAYFWTKQYHKAMQIYEDGLKIDPTNEACKDGKARTLMKIQDQATSGEVDEDAQRRAMADPEIQSILSDSYMNLVLKEMSNDPKRLQEYMRDPNIAAKINKLIAAGILRFGSGHDDGGHRGGRR